MAKTVLVTGASGQLGTTLKTLFGAQHQDFQWVYCRKHDLDITDPTQIEQWFSENNFDYCINCAAYTHVEKAEDEPEAAKNVNTVAVGHLARACKAYEVILIHLSTDYVFDGKKGMPYTEDDETKPLNIYGKTKREGERLIEQNLDAYYIIRTSWLYSVYGNNFMNTILNKYKAKEDIHVVSTQTGTPTSCSNLAHFLIWLLQSHVAFGTYNYSHLGECSWFDFATEIIHQIGGTPDRLKPVDTFPSKAKRPDYSVLSLDKIRTNYPNLVTWQTALNTELSYLPTSSEE